MKLFYSLLLLFVFTGAYPNKTVHQLDFTSSEGKGIIKKIDDLNAAALKIYLFNPNKARLLAQNALLLSKKNNYRLGIGKSFFAIGTAYWSQSYYPISLFYLNSALAYFKDTDHRLLLDCYRRIGRNYVDLKKYKQGLFYLEKSDEQSLGDVEGHEKVISEKAYAYLKSGQLDSCLVNVNEAIKLCRHIPNNDLAILYGRLSSLYIQQKLFDRASAYCDTAYAMSFTPNNKRLRTTILVSRSTIAFNRKDYKAAVQNAKQAAAMADSLGILEINSYADKALYQAYKKLGNKDKALFYQQSYIKLQDSLNNNDKQNSINIIQDYFSLNTKLNDIEEMQQKSKLDGIQIKSQRLTIYNLVFVILLLVVSVYLLYWYSRQRNKLSRQIQAKNNELLFKNQLIETQAHDLNELNQVKDRLLAVIGHDLKGPYANLRAIVDLFNDGQFSPDEVKDIMREFDPAIKSAELTLSNLVEWAGRLLRGSDTNITDVDLHSVADELALVFKNALAKKNISYHVNADAGQKAMADESHLKTILRNLVSNAIKFTPAGGNITISARQLNDCVIIDVADTGSGMAPPELSMLFSNHHFSVSGTQGEKGTGIGLLLCKQLVELNGGKIHVSSVEGEGSIFSFSLPAVILPDQL